MAASNNRMKVFGLSKDPGQNKSNLRPVYVGQPTFFFIIVDEGEAAGYSVDGTIKEARC